MGIEIDGRMEGEDNFDPKVQAGAKPSFGGLG